MKERCNSCHVCEFRDRYISAQEEGERERESGKVSDSNQSIHLLLILVTHRREVCGDRNGSGGCGDGGGSGGAADAYQLGDEAGAPTAAGMGGG